MKAASASTTGTRACRFESRPRWPASGSSRPRALVSFGCPRTRAPSGPDPEPSGGARLADPMEQALHPRRAHEVGAHAGLRRRAAQAGTLARSGDRQREPRHERQGGRQGQARASDARLGALASTPSPRRSSPPGVSSGSTMSGSVPVTFGPGVLCCPRHESKRGSGKNGRTRLNEYLEADGLGGFASGTVGRDPHAPLSRAPAVRDHAADRARRARERPRRLRSRPRPAAARCRRSAMPPASSTRTARRVSRRSRTSPGRRWTCGAARRNAS